MSLVEDPLTFIQELVESRKDFSWRDILLQLVKTGQLDPWDVDISLLTEHYLTLIRTLQAHDFALSGNILLAAALLLKLKADVLLEAAEQEPVIVMDDLDLPGVDDFYSMLETSPSRKRERTRLRLLPRTPQLKKRRVSIYELIDALEDAMRRMESQAKRARSRPTQRVEIDLPENTLDMHVLIQETLKRIRETSQGGRTTFSSLLREETREEKVYTFLPLLHLAHVELNEIRLEQADAFDEIHILEKKPANAPPSA